MSPHTTPPWPRPRRPHDDVVSDRASGPLFRVGAPRNAANAAAGEVSFKLEPGVAIPLGAPQSEIYDVGGAQSLKALFGLTPYLDLGPTASFVFLSPGSPGTESGVVWGVGPGLRLKRPHTAESVGGLSPWVDIDAL
jgi:hypothetical protein